MPEAVPARGSVTAHYFCNSFWNPELVMDFFPSIPQYAGRIPTTTQTPLDKLKQVAKLLPKF